MNNPKTPGPLEFEKRKRNRFIVHDTQTIIELFIACFAQQIANKTSETVCYPPVDSFIFPFRTKMNTSAQLEVESSHNLVCPRKLISLIMLI